MSASPCIVSKVAPLLGEDTEAVLTSLLKLSNEQIQELVAARNYGVTIKSRNVRNYPIRTFPPLR